MTKLDADSLLVKHMERLMRCRKCPAMVAPVVCGQPVVSEVLLVGQAPGSREGPLGRPFAWTAGKTLFRWFAQLGLEEQDFRARVYMAAVCRCFPGKAGGSDRVPSEEEIENCARWLAAELTLLRPKLVIPVGKLAIRQFLECAALSEVIGRNLQVEKCGVKFDLIALPHPSGASTWHRREPGSTLLQKALRLIGAHPAFRRLQEKGEGGSRQS